MKTPPQAVTDQLRHAVAQSGLSLYQIAKASGIDKSALSRFCRGERGLSTQSLDALGRILQVRLEVPTKAETQKQKGCDHA